MKKIFTITFLLLVSFNIHSQQITKGNVQADALIGEWTIDLRPTPDSEGYFQPFVVESIEGNTFKGTFYGSELQNSFLNENWEKLYFAFTTSDGSNEYYHSGYLLNGKLHGITYCPKRELTSPWTGERK